MEATVTPKNYLAFDLEIAADIPEGTEDWHALAPLGITVAGMAERPVQGAVVSVGFTGPDNAPRMDREAAARLVSYLQRMALSGYTIVTWNGLSFDFDVLAIESGMRAECAELALHHVDMMFHFFCLKGFPVALDKAAEAMGTVRKTEGMHGDLAPQMWRDGRFEEVRQYVMQDARATLELAYACEQRGRVEWITRAGARRVVFLPDGWLTVAEALKLPEPDQSWMPAPWPRTKFTGWLP